MGRLSVDEAMAAEQSRTQLLGDVISTVVNLDPAVRTIQQHHHAFHS